MVMQGTPKIISIFLPLSCIIWNSRW